MSTVTEYEVECLDCGSVFPVVNGSPLWWQAHQRSKRIGHFDCMKISGEKCGCKKKPRDPAAPFRVFGYDDMLRNFDIPCHTFVQAVTTFREFSRGLSVVSVSGLSEATHRRLLSL